MGSLKGKHLLDKLLLSRALSVDGRDSRDLLLARGGDEDTKSSGCKSSNRKLR